MNYNEFNQMLGKEVTAEQYEIIEKVYMNHPIIRNVDGKQQMLDLYNLGGMLLINDMAKRCDEILSTEISRGNIEAAIDNLKEERNIKIAEIEKEYQEELNKLNAEMQRLQKELHRLQK